MRFSLKKTSDIIKETLTSSSDPDIDSTKKLTILEFMTNTNVGFF